MIDQREPSGPPEKWTADLIESDAEIDAGRTVPLEPALARMLAVAAALEARGAADPVLSEA